MEKGKKRFTPMLIGVVEAMLFANLQRGPLHHCYQDIGPPRLNMELTALPLLGGRNQGQYEHSSSEMALGPTSSYCND